MCDSNSAKSFHLTFEAKLFSRRLDSREATTKSLPQIFNTRIFSSPMAVTFLDKSGYCARVCERERDRHYKRTTYSKAKMQHKSDETQNNFDLRGQNVNGKKF